LDFAERRLFPTRKPAVRLLPLIIVRPCTPLGIGIPDQRHLKKYIFCSSLPREDGEGVADRVDGESMTGVAVLRNRRVLAALPRSSDNALYASDTHSCAELKNGHDAEEAPWMLS
jgi:hypothetical protein